MGHPALLLQQLAQQSFGSLLIAAALDQNVENKALLVNGAPQLMLLAGDRDRNLVQVPSVAAARCTPANAVGEFPTECQAPLSDRLVANQDAARRQHLLDHA
jgi:hypothetical protein